MSDVKRDSGPNALRRGRVSIAHANYFVTVCVEPRKPILIPEPAAVVLGEAHRMTADSAWTLRCATVMPDHIHLFFALGDRLSLSQAIARLKFKTGATLRPRSAGWQENFYDHRLRPDDSVEATVRYIYQNPHQARLLSPNVSWLYFYCCPEDWVWFKGCTDSGRPFPEWLT